MPLYLLVEALHSPILLNCDGGVDGSKGGGMVEAKERATRAIACFAIVILWDGDLYFY